MLAGLSHLVLCPCLWNPSTLAKQTWALFSELSPQLQEQVCSTAYVNWPSIVININVTPLSTHKGEQ